MPKQDELEVIRVETMDRRYQGGDKVSALLWGIFHVLLYIARKRKGIF